MLTGVSMQGAGIVCMLHAHLGLSGWDVLHVACARRLHVGVGTCIIAVSLVCLLLWIPLGQRRIGIGTLGNAIVPGLLVNLVGPHVPDLTGPAWRAGGWALGTVLFATGAAVYIGAGLGPGTRDGLMTGLAARGWSLRAARTTIELTVLAAGMAIIGPIAAVHDGMVGIGTIGTSLAIGPIIAAVMPTAKRLAGAEPAGNRPAHKHNSGRHRRRAAGDRVLHRQAPGRGRATRARRAAAWRQGGRLGRRGA